MSVVACVVCKASVPASETELTGLGWRCRACSLRHQIDVHQGADEGIGHLSLGGMQDRVKMLRGALLATVGAMLLAVGFVASGVLPERLTIKAMGFVLAAIGAAIYEGVALRKAQRTVALMQSRESFEPER